ncbi:MAG: SusC/RagA family TonB-linked outer membrane protein [Fermentimonas sp.]|jgi:TonB-linked SusC/RagA family outer membrane protein
MNKCSIEGDKSLNNLKPTFKIVRITLFLLFLSVLCSRAAIDYSQGVELSLDRNNEEILNAIQQKRRITGTVTDVNGTPVIGANIVEVGTANGTVTDVDGMFSLSVGAEATIHISYIGYLDQYIATAGQSTFSVTLLEDAKTLDELVVIGYGTVKKSDLTGSIASIQGNKLAEKRTVRVSQALQGSMPGLMVTRSSSAADVSASIRVRGVTTIGDSNPLILIDGIPGNIDWVNPQDIESISVLKDAASASIYGARAAAGVILITTKKAKSGQFNINYNYQYTLEEPTRVAEYANAKDYMRVFNELTWNDNNNIPGKEYPIFAKDLIDNYHNLHAENPDKYPDVNWMDIMLKDNAQRENHSLNFNAGTESVRTYISLIYDKTNSLVEGRKYDRITFRANNDVTISKFLSAEVNLTNLYSVNKSPKYKDGYYGVDPSPLSAPIYAAQWSDGRVASGKTGRNDWGLLHYAGFNESKSNVLSGKIQVNFTPIKELKISAAFSPELFYDKGKGFSKQVTYTNWDDPNLIIGVLEGAEKTSLNESRFNSYSITNQLFSNYINNFNQHNLNIMVGFEEYKYNAESLGASRDHYLLKNFPYLSLGNENYQFNSGSAYENAYRSFFGRIMYNYGNKYYLQANSRYDGSSRFDKDYRWGFFPSVAIGWVLTEETFMKNISPFSFLKIRASYGSLGNEKIGNYPYQSTISFGNTILYQGDEAVSAQTSSISKYAIRNISWETTEVFNIGLDANLLNDKLRIEGDYYKKTTKDMLLALEIPKFMGVSNPQKNTGEMYTKGWEFKVSWFSNIGELKYSLSANLSDSKSIMGDLGGTEFLGSQVKFKGSEFNEWYGYKSDGLFQTEEEVANSALTSKAVRPGDIKYIDISGQDGVPDGKITPDYDRVLLGGSLPRYLFGGNIDMTYKNVDFSLVFQGIGKQNSMITQNMVRPLQSFYRDVPKIILNNYWSKYNTEQQNLSIKYPRLSENTTGNNYTTSDFWLFNGGYFRLKNIQLGYKIPNDICTKVKLQDIYFYLSIHDLFSIDNFPKGWDPETTNYWITRSYNFGVSLKF